MFSKETYTERRDALRKLMSSGIVVFPGNVDSPMNYPANILHFRQDSNFLYYFGLDKPGFTGIVDIDNGKDYIYGEDFTVDDIIWMGPQATVSELAAGAGVENTGNSGALAETLKTAISQGRKVHFLAPYRGEHLNWFEDLLGLRREKVKDYVSAELTKAVVKQRSVKTDEEIVEMEKALDISWEMYQAVLKNLKPGMLESEIVGIMQGVWGSYDSHYSFPPIVSVRGETLHNHYHGNKMKAGELLLVDSGVESPEYYASDITRTFPVSGKFTDLQKQVYSVVLKSQYESIGAIKPGVTNKELHLKTSAIIAEGLKELGLMKGNVDDAVKAGAHALFYPHGLGHMIGLDVHDMEGMGENYVGYDETVSRSDQFGLAYLRLARKLEKGFVITVEPGIYFIPALIDKWRKEGICSEFINFDKVEEMKGFGGIRIEDDILITDNGYRVLGKPIPKEISEIEEIMNR